MANALEQLKSFTTVVADTGEFGGSSVCAERFAIFFDLHQPSRNTRHRMQQPTPHLCIRYAFPFIHCIQLLTAPLHLQAAQMEKYSQVVNDAIDYAKSKSKDENEQIELAADALFVNFGCEILKLIPGRVSTEVDARCRPCAACV